MTNMTSDQGLTHKTEVNQTLAEKANSLRAAVLGSNDGILTVVGVLFSVAVATTNTFTIFIAGLADLLACAFSMASGEYASVSSQRDTEQQVVEQEQRLLDQHPYRQAQIVADYYEKRGLKQDTAQAIAAELMEKAPLATLVKVKHNLVLGHYMNPWQAAWSSLFAAALGGVLPLVAMTVLPSAWQWPGTIVAVIFSVALTGFLSAKWGGGKVKVAVIRNVGVGIITMMIHYGLGLLL